MLMIVSDSLKSTPTLSEVARELSLTVSHFRDTPGLKKLMAGRGRRVVFLSAAEVDESLVRVLRDARAHTAFGVIVCAERDALRSSSRANSLNALGDFENIEWLKPAHDVDELSYAARCCRRRMLTLGKDELEDAILDRQFLIQYQPKVERTAGTEWLTREAEALIRWHHPQHGLLGPLEFLPEAEAFGLIGPISEIVLYEAASQLVKWREQGLNLNSCINLASSQLANQELPQSYARIVEQHDLDCASFTFEVIERDMAHADRPHYQVLQALRERGFRISLDDFGIAASSLSAFEQFPFDEIKIHARALQRARANPVAQNVLAAVTGLAHKLDVAVCAEGVEDQETFEFLKTIECDKMQGFYISEAVMPEIIRRVYSAKEAVEDVA